MTGPVPGISLIVPVRNGADFLPGTLRELRSFLQRDPDAEVVLVDDGSEPRAAKLLASFACDQPHVILLVNEVNRGKGAAVARGMLAARGRYRVFTDADLAYPLDQLPAIGAALDAGHDVAVACRVLPQSRYLMSPTFFHYLYTRHLMSRWYNALVRWTLLPGILDSQAGLKGFSARAAGIIFPRVTVPGFGFDVEALLIARRHELKTVQVPVHFRYDSEPTTVRLAHDGGTLLTDLVRIRWNDLRGRYR
ncbi:MAG TPA: glycosyltransferase [Gemmatimonadales bacterium]|nr:glycosyltransferase [Gemmatimonadales bacterium]